MTTGLRLLRGLLILSLAFPGLAHADPLPLWEAGAGVAVLRLPDYRGSNESHGYVLPVPYFIYRGDRLKVDRESVRGALFKTDRLQMDISFSGAPPVRAGSNQARAGMPGLGASGQIGPALKIRLLPHPRAFSADLQLPLRAAVVAQHGLRTIGCTFNPRLDLGWRTGPETRAVALGLSFGPMFGDRRYNGYYYTVAPQYATAGRAAWMAPAGYAGTRLVLSATAQRGDYWVGAFARADDLGGSRLVGSPLVTARRSYGVGFAVARILARARQAAPDSDAP